MLLFRRMRRLAVFVGLLFVTSTHVIAQQPDRWERFVAAFDEEDKVTPPLKHQIVFVGSSTIYRWDVASYEKPRRDLYVEDGLHLSPQGYQLWTTVLKPYLVQR